jgi:ABC-type sulfate transport system permease component
MILAVAAVIIIDELESLDAEPAAAAAALLLFVVVLVPFEFASIVCSSIC